MRALSARRREQPDFTPPELPRDKQFWAWLHKVLNEYALRDLVDAANDVGRKDYPCELTPRNELRRAFDVFRAGIENEIAWLRANVQKTRRQLADAVVPAKTDPRSG
jgi:hypothetical protein